MSDLVPASEVPLVVCDANVFYSIVLTDLLLSLSVAELLRPRWTAQIHEEWMRNLLVDRPELERAKIERRRDMMDRAIDDCLITGYESLIPTLQLPDADDCHVLAAAIHSQAQIILTSNLRDFPATVLAPYSIVAQGPDEFLTQLVEQHPTEVQSVIAEMRARKTRPPVALTELLQKLAQQNLPQFVARLRTLFAV
jgi:predicted nucleic acid-binding protein